MTDRLATLGSDAEYFFEEGCYILEIANSQDDPAVSIARARVPAGMTTHRHRLHGVTERYVILEGTGAVHLGSSAPHVVHPGDFVHIPPLCSQSITNTGSDDLVFLAICTPRFTPEAYEDLERNV